ncbi:winged helix-turn-helix transcriptional regulator [Methanovulcanius yangii]|uniref:winged helix-turn-helix transcriptional regulator n=1 Tax=Methanovulcanius yangii TaxID=1789227 RepID=UPI0029CA690E|nr:winged helix-turn-helix transcriptional regulator [Methanovulcanius yangii]
MAGRRPLTLICILILFVVYLIGPATAEPGGYVVQPAPDTDPNEERHEFTPISFWDLSPRAMLIGIALSISPALIFPVELLFAVKLWIYLGYRKVAKYNVLNNTVRSEMFECICNNPGITFSALARKCNIGKGTQQYHLKLLMREHKIVSVKKKGQTGFFENDDKYEEIHRTILMQLRSDTVRQIYEILIRHPTISRKELARYLGISGSAVTWQMERLCADGTVFATKSGKYTCYLLNPEVKEILRDYLPDNPVAHVTDLA